RVIHSSTHISHLHQIAVPYRCLPTQPAPTFSFFFYCSGDHRDLHSFPTRRSSDLETTSTIRTQPSPRRTARPRRAARAPIAAVRSEEHTSELQSLRHLVCRLLLEKKK